MLTQTDRTNLVSELLAKLADEQPSSAEILRHFDQTDPDHRRLALRALLNVRPADPVPEEILVPLGRLLDAEAFERGSVEVNDLPGAALDRRLALVRANIITLRADAIVNAANSALLGCFLPLHSCIDNAIHSAAGPLLRQECAEIMGRRGSPEPTGTATVTRSYHLPASSVIHTVGPIVSGPVTREHARLLAACYRSSLAAASERGLTSIALCCVSTGVFGYPKPDAARVAVHTVLSVLDEHPTLARVVFTVFNDEDEAIYRELLGHDFV